MLLAGSIQGMNRRTPIILLDPLLLGIPVKARYGLAKRPPRRGRWRPSHSVKRPDCLRRLGATLRSCPRGQAKSGSARDRHLTDDRHRPPRRAENHRYEVAAAVEAPHPIRIAARELQAKVVPRSSSAPQQWPHSRQADPR